MFPLPKEKLLAALCLASLASATPLRRQSATQYLFSFGDSYTQSGFDIDGEQPSSSDPTGNPAEGSMTFSGGPVYVEYLTYNYNTSLVLTYDFGYGGATISDSIVANSPQIHSFEEQVEQYYEPKYSTPGGANAPWSADTAIFTTFFGINDLILSYNNGTTDVDTLIPQLVSKYFSLWDNLRDTGAAKFLLIGVPPVDRSPYVMGSSSQNPTTLSNAINELNGQLAAAADNWASDNGGTNVQIYDFHAWMTQVLDDPTAYGFQDAVCAGSGTSNCIWWDGSNLHTTSTFQNLLAKDMVTKLTALGW